MKIQVFQHVPFEGLAMIGEWANKNHHSLSYTHFYEDNAIIPQLEDIDALIIMGGPMGVYDIDKYEWLKGEKAFIKNAIDNGKPVLGICLGAQLIAASLGANVAPNKQKEIGYFEVKKLSNHSIIENIPPIFTPLHWHGDRFEIPNGAIHILSSQGCDNQGFIYKDKVLALQFHLEMDLLSVELILGECADEIESALESDRPQYIQNAQTILEMTKPNENRKFLFAILDKLFA